MTRNEFIEKAKLKHGDKYDYSLVEYKNNKTKIIIICNKHGEFIQRPCDHLNGSGCSKCAGKYMDIKIFIEKGNVLHLYKYDYSSVNYINNKSKVCIKCPTHGEFWQTPNNHIRQKQGCPKCSGLYKTTEEFIEKAIKIHNNKYNYSKAVFNGDKINICIICPIHGEFWQKPNAHYVSGCLKCGKIRMAHKNTKTIDEFLAEANEVHGNKYDYSEVKYVKALDYIEIICPIHGKFKQVANNHLRGQGCPLCVESRGEKTIYKILSKYQIYFVREYKFDNCKNKQKLPFDFYLPKYNICIEYDGKQHYMHNKFFGDISAFHNTQRNDQIKTNFCFDNKIKLIRIPYTEFNNIEEILKKELKL